MNFKNSDNNTYVIGLWTTTISTAITDLESLMYIKVNRFCWHDL